jgi:NADH:ubiquinone oxidoreductase subunit C
LTEWIFSGLSAIMDEIIGKVKSKFDGVKIKENSPKRIYIEINRERAKELAEYFFKEEGMRFSIATGMDTRKGFEILYHFSLDSTGVIYSIRVYIPKDDPKIDSFANFLPATEWIEREMHELLGIEFEGHPNLKPLLTDADLPWDNKHPLKKYK